MTNPPPPRFPSDELRQTLLDYEDWTEELLNRRRPKPKDTWWNANTKEFLAILTVLASAGIGFYTGTAQQGRAAELARRESILKQEQELLLGVNRSLGQVFKVTEDRFKIATGRWRALPDSMLFRYISAANVADDAWRVERETMGMQIHFFFAAPELATAWDSTRGSMEAYTSCVEAKLNAMRSGYAPADICVIEQASARQWSDTLKVRLIKRYNADVLLEPPVLIAQRGSAGGS
jgi:hypothetical protein